MQEKKRVKFFMTTLIGGVIFLVPVVFLVMVVLKAISLMKLIARPMANWFPVETIGGVALADIIAITALLVLCFLAGMIARHAFVSAIIRQLENTLLKKLPGYVMIKNVLKGFDTSQEGVVKPVVLQMGSVEQLGIEVQRLADGRSVVFIPESPNAFAGTTQVIPADMVTYLDVQLNSVFECSKNYGHGLDLLLQAKVRQ